MLILWSPHAHGDMPPYDEEKNQKYTHMSQTLKHLYHDHDKQSMHAVHAGEADKPAILFIHGAPGDWKAWGRYLNDDDFLNNYFMISVDRPGYGHSAYGNPQTNFKKQAAAIIQTARQAHKGPFLLVGHSYGGPLAIQIAIDFPDDISGMILLASAHAPSLHSSRWYHIAANTLFVRPFLTTPLRVTTKEMLTLKGELDKQTEHLSAIQAPTIVVQGEKDWLVPSGNADYAEKKLINADVKIVKLKKQGHFLPWNEYQLVKKMILEQFK